MTSSTGLAALAVLVLVAAGVHGQKKPGSCERTCMFATNQTQVLVRCAYACSHTRTVRVRR